MKNNIWIGNFLFFFIIFINVNSSFGVDGEFKNYCANSLANSRVYQTKCEVNETIDGKVYCFGSQNSKEAFLKDPKENLKKAQDYFLALPKN